MNLLNLAWKKWLKIGRAIGHFQGQVIFTIFYFTIFLPIGLGVKLFSDVLNIKSNNGSSNFKPWDHPQEGIEQAHKPY
ncbi:MAG TPA: hypothetical protein VG965_03400 [Patescibacteria group bacterium]|nr:hypothetical protein [Patescibacteria group bacterium]